MREDRGVLAYTSVPSLPDSVLCRRLYPPLPFLFSSELFKRMISSWYSLNSASLGSSLILGLFLMFLARFAYLEASTRLHSHMSSKIQIKRNML